MVGRRQTNVDALGNIYAGCGDESIFSLTGYYLQNSDVGVVNFAFGGLEVESCL